MSWAQHKNYELHPSLTAGANERALIMQYAMSTQYLPATSGWTSLEVAGNDRSPSRKQSTTLSEINAMAPSRPLTQPETGE